jgi:hypothetical protein
VADTPSTGYLAAYVTASQTFATSNGATTNFWWFGGSPNPGYHVALTNHALVFEGELCEGAAIPTLSWLGLLALAVLLAGAGVFVMLRR